MALILKDLLNQSGEEVLVFYLGKGWQVHVWNNGEVYIQGLKYEGKQHWTTFKKIKVDLCIGKEVFLKRVRDLIENQTFEWEQI